jgi:hypothetical protein
MTKKGIERESNPEIRGRVGEIGAHCSTTTKHGTLSRGEDAELLFT